jgi:hypothetical protein
MSLWPKITCYCTFKSILALMHGGSDDILTVTLDIQLLQPVDVWCLWRMKTYNLQVQNNVRVYVVYSMLFFVVVHSSDCAESFEDVIWPI